ncbi:putative exported protein of unknown function [Methylobacterium sp. 4-46]|uniref:DUF5666 domain-containing protein n=1 Tax=unclassified Methylobacterium TaxID=2615210 RepID=UPI000165CDEA|nr:MULTISPECIES: DUF5666 domain-containing protein [Methylobacterium]ACA20450.1 putative exported protein of unknown function [Methylobacterium sp. 4-46]WFT79620.1 DUF5666 domain-containing protein [Methylobacterium nodulans]
MADALSRRALLRLLSGGAALALPRPAGAAGDGIRDQGIGGTGTRPGDEEGDRGIGGTGVIGTIRAFGSIVVNDLRIAYAPDVPVAIDGRPATASDLRLDQVVQVVARAGEAGVSAARIDVVHEVVGPVSAVGRGRLTVLGQSVVTAGAAAARSWRLGERVAVSGLRRPDGRIAASRVDPAGDLPSRVAGPVRRDPGGTPRIGALPLPGLAPGLVGGRAVVEGRSAEAPFGPEVGRVSLEAYVAREGGRLRLGSGLAVAGSAPALPRGGGLAVIEAAAGPAGRLTARDLRLRPGSSEGGARPGGAGPTDRGGFGGPGRSGRPRRGRAGSASTAGCRGRPRESAAAGSRSIGGCREIRAAWAGRAGSGRPAEPDRAARRAASAAGAEAVPSPLGAETGRLPGRFGRGDHAAARRSG